MSLFYLRQKIIPNKHKTQTYKNEQKTLLTYLYSLYKNIKNYGVLRLTSHDIGFSLSRGIDSSDTETETAAEHREHRPCHIV